MEKQDRHKNSVNNLEKILSFLDENCRSYKKEAGRQAQVCCIIDKVLFHSLMGEFFFFFFPLFFSFFLFFFSIHRRIRAERNWRDLVLGSSTRISFRYTRLVVRNLRC